MDTLNPTTTPAPLVAAAGDSTQDLPSTPPEPGMDVPEDAEEITRTPVGATERVYIPEDLLAAARTGMPLREIARILGTRLGRTVSRETVRKWLVRGGIRQPRPRSVTLAAITGGDDMKFTEHEHRRLTAYHAARKARVRDLLRRAQGGDRMALTALYDRYKLRLPLIEERLDAPMPWRKSASGDERSPSPPVVVTRTTAHTTQHAA
jgi:hypothetical protein